MCRILRVMMSELRERGPEMDENAGVESLPSVESRSQDKTPVVLAVHFSNMLYACCFWINVGVYPYITKSLGVDMVMYGYLQMAFGALQLLGGPVYGRLGDIFGSRAVLVLAHVCGMLSYMLISIASNVVMLFLARVPSLLMHGAQERSAALGRLGFSYGAGVIIGPFLGGQLSKYFSKRVAMLSAGCLSCFAIVFVMIFIPKFTRKKEKTSEKQEISIFNLPKFKQIISCPGVGFIYMIKLIAGVPFGIFQSMFAVVVVNTFKLTPAQHGTFMSYVGILMILVQGFGVGFVTKRMNEKNVLTFSMILCSFAYFIWFLSTTIIHLIVLVMPLVFGGALFTVVTNSIVTKLVPSEDTGFVLGLSFATQSFIRTLSPAIGGLLLTHFGHASFGIVGFTICSFVASYLFVKKQIHTDTELE